MNWVNKERLAECLDVSIRSVERYQSLGMPHKKNESESLQSWLVHPLVHWLPGSESIRTERA